MTSQDNISTEEAELMLYVFDELDSKRRAAMDARLSNDALLRQRLAELRGVNGRFFNDSRMMSVPVSDRALRASLRVVREQMMLRNSTTAVAPRFRVPAYAVAAGVAVAFTLGFLAWLYSSSPQTTQPAPLASNRPAPGFGFPGSGDRVSISSGFVPSSLDIYADSSREIDQEIDALSMLADFETDSNSN